MPEPSTLADGLGRMAAWAREGGPPASSGSGRSRWSEVNPRFGWRSSAKRPLDSRAVHPAGRAPGQRFRYEQYITPQPDGTARIRGRSGAAGQRNHLRPGQYLRKAGIAARGFARRLKHPVELRRYDVVFVQREALLRGAEWSRNPRSGPQPGWSSTSTTPSGSTTPPPPTVACQSSRRTHQEADASRSPIS